MSRESAARKIIFDTDPGQDDMAAILMALASPQELEVLGIVAVAGNVPLHHTERNARRICELAGRGKVPVFAGSDTPMGRKLVTAEHVHGKTGLDGPDLPEPKAQLQKKPGVDFLIETLRAAQDGEITLCTLGPLTDIGLVLTRAPEVKPKIREIVMMAGAYFEVGNITPAAEFNVYVDPTAADLVFKSGVPIDRHAARRHASAAADPAAARQAGGARQSQRQGAWQRRSPSRAPSTSTNTAPKARRCTIRP